MVKKILIGLGIFFVVLIIIGASSDNKSGPTKTGESNQNIETEQETQQTEFKVGEIVKLKDYELTVNSVKHLNSLGEYQKPKSGKEYVVVNVTIKNNGKNEISYNPLDFKLQNSNGAQETYDWVSVDDSLSSGTLASDGKITGSIPFEETIGDTGLKLIFQPNSFSENRITVNLQ